MNKINSLPIEGGILFAYSKPNWKSLQEKWSEDYGEGNMKGGHTCHLKEHPVES